ncbi:MAG: DUF3465 domain-containing protein [bacterium]|nr:DUF3465 domain-containing protein [bacterium]
MSPRLRRALLGIVAAVALAIAQQAGWIGGDAAPSSAPVAAAPHAEGGNAALERALEARASGVMMTVDARVVKVLPDDLDGSRHQRFLLDVGRGRTVLVAHNIDLAERVPLDRQDTVRIRGQFEWNDKGGVLHWTHHDPRGRHPGGWIEHAGRRFE